MRTFKTFAEYLEQRSDSCPADIPDRSMGREAEAAPTQHSLREPRKTDDDTPVSERTVFRNPFRGVFKAINPARPVSPTNSRLLASTARKRLRSQVIGR